MKKKVENRKNIPFIRRVLTNKAFIIGVSIICLYTTSGFFLAPYLIARLAPGIIADKLDREVRMGKVRVNPFLMRLESNDFLLFEKDGSPIARYNRIFVDFQLSSIFRWAWTFKTFSLEKPIIHLVIEPDGTLNLAKLIPVSSNAPEPKSDKEDVPRPPRLILQHIEILEGAIKIADKRVSVPAEVELSPLNIRLNEISTLPEREGPYSLVATTADGESIQWIGEIALHPFQSSGRLSFDNIKTSTLWKFARDAVHMEVPKGMLSLAANYVIHLGHSQPKIMFKDANFRMRGLGVQLLSEDAPFFELAQMDIKATQVDLIEKRIDIENVLFNGARGLIRVDENGALNVSTLTGTKEMDQTQAAVPSSEPSSLVEPAETENIPWTVRMKEIAFQDIAVEYDAPYQVPSLNAGISNIEGMFRLEGTTGGTADRWDIEKAHFDLSKLWIKNPESPFTEMLISRLALEDAFVHLDQQDLGISKITLEGGDIHIVREENGEINLMRLLAPDDSVKAGGSSRQQTKEKNPWRFLVKTVQLSDFTTAFSDKTVRPDAPLVNIDDLRCTIDTIDGKSPMRIHTAFDIRQGGNIDIGGVINPSDLRVETDVLISELALPAFQPYVEPYVNLRLAAGAFSTKGKLLYGGGKKTPKLGYEGEFDVSGLQLLETATDNLFLGWENLEVSKLKFKIQPDLLEIEDIKLFQMEGKFIISDDGTVNFADIMKRPEDDSVPNDSSDSSDQSDGDAFPIAIHKLRIEDGSLFFADFGLIPQFATKIHQLNGMIAGISSNPGSRTKIQLDGRVDDYGVSKINGEIESFDPKAFTDMSVVFKNIEMTSATPYSGKFVGRKIDSGKLSLDLKYYIENKKLQGNNQIIVERIKLGDRVESPDAVSLPLNLAVALLEDSNGIIDIGLPVKGDLENPEFSFGPLIWKAFVNVIKKIASAPFRALGALLGGDSDDLDSVAFEAGMAAVPPPEIEKLVRLAKVLNKRPNLKLIVQGCYSDELDGLTFRELNIRRTLSQRMGFELAAGEDPGPIDHGNAKVMNTLSALFVERFGESELETIRVKMNLPKEGTTDDKKQTDPKKAAYDLRSLSEKIYTRLVDSEAIDEVLLKQLAGERTKRIIEELTVKGGLDADRVATKEIQSLKPQKPVKAKLNLTSLP